MKVSLAALALFTTAALGAKTTSLCISVTNKVIENNGVCSSAGGKALGKGICCFDQANALVKSRFQIACDDQSGTVRSTGEGCV